MIADISGFKLHLYILYRRSHYQRASGCASSQAPPIQCRIGLPRAARILANLITVGIDPKAVREFSLRRLCGVQTVVRVGFAEPTPIVPRHLFGLSLLKDPC